MHRPILRLKNNDESGKCIKYSSPTEYSITKTLKREFMNAHSICNIYAYFLRVIHPRITFLLFHRISVSCHFTITFIAAFIQICTRSDINIYDASLFFYEFLCSTQIVGQITWSCSLLNLQFYRSFQRSVHSQIIDLSFCLRLKMVFIGSRGYSCNYNKKNFCTNVQNVIMNIVRKKHSEILLTPLLIYVTLCYTLILQVCVTMTNLCYLNL